MLTKAFAFIKQAIHQLNNTTEHGRRKGGQRPWILKISAKKFVFVSSRKKQISPLSAPPRKIFVKIH